MNISDTSTTKSTLSKTKSMNEGDCLQCGYRLSVCGRPFTADIQCPKCNTVNAYVESYQPVTVKAAVEVFEVTVAA
jgi:hypothetical protein